MWFSLSLFVCSLFSSGAEARNAAAFPGASAPFVLGGCKAGPAGGRAFCGSSRTLPRRERCFFLYRPSGPTGTAQPSGNLAPCPSAHAAKSASGPAGTSCFAGIPAPSPASHVAFFFIRLAGLTALPTFRATSHFAMPTTLPKLASGPAGTSCPAGTPAPSPAAHDAFSLLSLAEFALQLTCRVGSAASFWSAFHALLFLPYPCGGKAPGPFYGRFGCGWQDFVTFLQKKSVQGLDNPPIILYNTQAPSVLGDMWRYSSVG